MDTLAEQTTTAVTPTPRYREPRVLLRWDKNPHLKVLKMLAWLVWSHEGRHSAAALETRVAALYPSIVLAVLGEQVTLAEVRATTLAEQGVAITAVKLQQRADKTERYSELNEYADAVIRAYEQLRVA
jgi:hypothetical protein